MKALRLLVLVLCTLIIPFASAAPRPPVTPVPELTLKSWRFDQPDYMDAVSLGAHRATNIWLAESWSGYALDMRAQDALLLTPAVRSIYSTNYYHTNFTEGSGTLRLWLAPAWASTSAGGTGPGDWATLFELAQTNTVPNPFGFALAIDPAGTNIVAALNTTTGVVTLVQRSISWSTGVWHQIAFVYWPEGVSLVVDDSPEQLSATVPVWPSSSIWNQSAFSLGSAFDASQPVMGLLDDVHTFSFPLTTNYLTWLYQYLAPIAALGPLSGEEFQNSSSTSPCDPCPTNGGNFTSSPKAWVSTSAFRFASNPAPQIVSGSFVTTLRDTNSANTAYQIFQATNLGIAPSNTQWTLATNGTLGQTNFTLPFSTNTTNAFFLAARATDTDDDGLSDAYEGLVSKTVVNTNDTDGDGIDDNHLTLYFELKDPPESSSGLGNFIRGPGFKVWGSPTNTSGEPHGELWFQFQQIYRGLPLNVWNGDGPPAAHDSKVIFKLPGATGTFVKYFLKYDLRNIWLSVSNGATPLTNAVFWRDNMTETLGSDGPASTWATNAAWITNVSYTPAALPRRSRYVWEGAIGNTSQEKTGPSVHSPWWPILKMVSQGTNTFYTAGYNEGKWDVQKFHTANPQFVVTNVSRSGSKNLADKFAVDLAIQNQTNLFVRYTNIDNTGLIVKFDVSTGAKLQEGGGLTFPTPPTIGFTTNGYGALALHPENSSLAALYYTNREQVVVYTNAQSASPTVLFTIGVMNGYSNGPAITTPTNTHDFRTNQLKLCSYYFDKGGNLADDHRLYRPIVCFQSDGKLWVGDTATSRMLRFDTSGFCDSWFMFVAHSYAASVDPNDPKRAFMGFLEFEVDYNKPFSNSWVLKNYWGRTTATGAPEIERDDHTIAGLFTVTTFTNGRTYALVWQPPSGNQRRIVELTSTGLRISGITAWHPLDRLEADGARLYITESGSTATFNRDYLTGFNASGDPTYATSADSTVSFTDGVHPVARNYKRAGTTNITFYPDWNYDGSATVWPGYHLGAVASGAWKWTNAPTARMNGRGNYDPNCDHAGSDHHVVSGDIFFVYRGEYWRSPSGATGQGNQIFHYKLDGTFVGQFGTPRFVDGTAENAPGAAGSLAKSAAIQTNGFTYLFTNDEWSHGLHRWRIEP